VKNDVYQQEYASPPTMPNDPPSYAALKMLFANIQDRNAERETRENPTLDSSS
jgi:hypothetical protein